MQPIGSLTKTANLTQLFQTDRVEKKMQRQNVSSSNIKSIGYDNSTSVLEVEFLNGNIYQYSNVPERLYVNLMNASSHGEYLDAYIKKGGYSYTKVR